jgi:predicted nucleic acid-binding protein
VTASAPWRETPPADPALLRALARAAAALARLDQASHRHPLLPALLYRARLEAVRRQAAADGLLIDPWHLAALIEGLRPRRLSGARSLAEAGEVFEAGRAALALHRWLTAPDFDDEGTVLTAETALQQDAASGVALLDAAAAAWRWLEAGGARAPLRAALVRRWVAAGLLRAPLPLEDSLALLADLERNWTAARHATAGRRRHSRTPARHAPHPLHAGPAG